MASLAQRTWVGASSGSWWRTGKPREQFTGSQRVEPNFVTNQWQHCVLSKWMKKRTILERLWDHIPRSHFPTLLLTSSVFHSYLYVFLWSKIYFCLLCKVTLKFPLGFICQTGFSAHLSQRRNVSVEIRKKKYVSVYHLSEGLNWKINRQFWVLAMMWSNQNSHALLVGMQNGTGFLEKVW